tara:strand:- start:7451 stop:7726 length:276 start_codon:yes stop_codon:yes gene_type:complete
MKMNDLSIVAHKITEKKIYYKCPFCFSNKNMTRTYGTNFFKNGRPANRCATIHHHGNETQALDNFETSRSSHCSYSDGEVRILITDDTIRE